MNLSVRTSWARQALVLLACGGLAWVMFPRLAGGPRQLSVLGHELLLQAPVGLLGFLALPWLWLVQLDARRDGTSHAAQGSMLLRALTWATLTLALCRPQWMGESKPASLVLVLDESQSIREADQQKAQRFVREILALGKSRDVHVIRFAEAPQVVTPPKALFTNKFPALVPSATDATDIARALTLAMTLPVASETRRAVLLSDGLATHGDCLDAADNARMLGVPIDIVALDTPPPAEAAVTAFGLPDQVRQGQRFALSVTVESNHNAMATLRLIRHAAAQEVAVNSQEVQLSVGETLVDFSDIVREQGTVHYRCELDVHGPDRLMDNNHVEGGTSVLGPPSVLLIDPTPTHLSALAAAFEAANYQVDLRTPAGLSSRTNDLERFAAIVLSNIADDDLNSAQLAALSEAVHHGGFLLWAGGDRGWTTGATKNAALSRMLPIVTGGAESEDEASAALSLLIDASGSMAGEKLDLAKTAASAAVQLLHDDDLVEVVGFAGSPERIVRLQKAVARRQIIADIRRLLPHGGTALLPALELAYQDLSVARAALKHVVLLTDGQTDEGGLPTLANLLRGEGITLSTVGLGADVNRELLATLANLTGGRAHFTNDPTAVPRIFMQETSRVRHSSTHEGHFRIRKIIGADFLHDLPIAAAPALRGHGVTHAKPGAQVILGHDDGHPLLVRQRLGLGYVLAWTSDLSARWSAGLVRWSLFPKFLAQLTREHQHAHDQQRLELNAVQDGTQVRVIANALSSDGRSLDGLSGTLHAGLHSYLMHQVGPGRYEAYIPQEPSPGSTTLHAELRREDQVIAEGHGRVRPPQPTELSLRTPDTELLRLLSARTGGMFGAKPRSVLSSPPTPRRQQAHPMHLPLIVIALVLFLAELAGRRRLSSVPIS